MGVGRGLPPALPCRRVALGGCAGRLFGVLRHPGDRHRRGRGTGEAVVRCGAPCTPTAAVTRGRRGLLEGVGALGANSEQLQSGWGALYNRLARGQQEQSNDPRNNQHNPQYANYWAPLTRKRHIPPHSAQPRHTNCWAPRTRKRHQQEHRLQRPTERSDPTPHAEGRAGGQTSPFVYPARPPMKFAEENIDLGHSWYTQGGTNHRTGKRERTRARRGWSAPHLQPHPRQHLCHFLKMSE